MKKELVDNSPETRDHLVPLGRSLDRLARREPILVREFVLVFVVGVEADMSLARAADG
jgi:hypothetical protein